MIGDTIVGGPVTIRRETDQMGDMSRTIVADMNDADRDPEVVIAYLVGQPLDAQQIHEAFGLSRSGYRKARDEHRLITADHLLRVADHFGLNPLELMIRFGLISEEAVSDLLERGHSGHFGRAPVWNRQLAQVKSANVLRAASSAPGRTALG